MLQKKEDDAELISLTIRISDKKDTIKNNYGRKENREGDTIFQSKTREKLELVGELFQEINEGISASATEYFCDINKY